MAQTIQIKRGGFSGLGSLSLAAGEMALVTGSIPNIDSLNRFITINDGTNTLLPAGAVLTGSVNPNISSYSELNGALFYNSTDKQLVRLDSAGNQNLDIAATVENTLTIGSGLFGSSFDGSTPVTISVDSGSIAINDLNGTLSVANGGTGATTLTDHGVLVGSGTDPITALAVGNDGQLLVGQSNNDPSFQTVSGVINIDNAGATTFTSTANSLISGAFTATSASIATNISTNEGNISTNAGNISANASNISTNASNIATLTAQTSSYLQSADLNGYVSTSGTPADNQLAIFTDADTVEGSANITYDGATFTVNDDVNLGSGTHTVTIGNNANATINIGHVSNTTTILGNLTVAGTTTTVNSDTVTIADNIIQLNSDSDGVANAGIEVLTGAVTASLLYDVTNTWWETNDGTTSRRIISYADDAGSTDISFVYTDTNGYLAHIDVETPADTAGTFLQWNGSAMVASHVIDGGTF